MIARNITPNRNRRTRHHAATRSTITSIFAVLCLLFPLLQNTSARAQDRAYQLYTLADELRWPWSVALLPDGDLLVTEREGRLLRLRRNGQRQVLAGTPATYFAGQGGYFDIAVHPQFEENPYIYLSYAEGTPEANGTAIFRARYSKGILSEGERLLRVSPNKGTSQHYGGRLLFLADNSLLVTIGEGFEYREKAQNLESELGKVLRIFDDGRPGGAFKTDAGTDSRVWSYGHRNPQGLARDPESDTVFLHEHGPRGGDEVNIIVAGENYGWPVVTHGVDYSGAYVTPFRYAPGMQDPLKVWTPSIAPSGMAWYDGERFPKWRDSLFIGALVDREVRRLRIENGQIVDQETLFSELNERIRDVRAFGDRLLILTDGEEGKLIEVLPR